MSVTHCSRIIEGNFCVFEIPVFDFLNSRRPIIRYTLKTKHSTKDSTCTGRIAIRILSTAGADIKGFSKIPLSIKKANNNICSIDLCIDIKCIEHPIRAANIG